MALQLFETTEKTPRLRLYRDGKTPRSLYQEELNELRSRGYKNEKLNLEKLAFYRGNIQAVIMEYDLTPRTTPDGTKMFDESILSPLCSDKPEEEEFSPREAELLSKLLDLESRMEDLEAEHEEDIENLIRDHEEDVREIRNELHLRIKSLDAENESVKSAHRELLAENLTLKRRARSASMTNLAEKRGRAERLEHELELERRAVEGMEDTIDALEKENNSLTIKLKRSEKENKKLIQEADVRQSKISSLEDLVVTQNQLVKTIQGKVSDLESQVSELESNLSLVEMEREHQNNVIFELEKRNAESEELIDGYDQELALASLQLEACVERINALERELSVVQASQRHRASFLEWFDGKFLTTVDQETTWKQYREKFVECGADDLTWWVDLMEMKKKDSSEVNLTEILSDWIGMEVDDQKAFCRRLEEMEVFVASKAGCKMLWDENDTFRNEFGQILWTDDGCVDLIQSWREENKNRLGDFAMAKLMFYVNSLLC